jgi:hypothetical protein
MSNYYTWNPYICKKCIIISCFRLVMLWMILHCLLIFCHEPVDIPPWFSAVSIALNSDVDLVSMLISVILFRLEQPRILLASALIFVAWNNFISLIKYIRFAYIWHVWFPHWAIHILFSGRCENRKGSQKVTANNML